MPTPRAPCSTWILRSWVTTGHPPRPLPASHHHVDIRCYSLLVGVPDILIIVVIWYRENVLGDTKAVFRCTLCHLKRFLVHGIGTHGYRAGILYTMFRAAGWMLTAGLAALGTRGRGPRQREGLVLQRASHPRVPIVKYPYRFVKILYTEDK